MDEDLFSAIEAENYGLAKVLISKGAKADNLVRDGISTLHLIAGHESQEAAKVLEYCAQHADPNVKSSEGLTPVHVAALWGRLQNLKILTSHGGDINQTDDEGNNALDFACLSGENSATTCIKFLLELESSKPHVNVHVDSGHEHTVDSDFTDSFYTAIEESNESVLDHTVVTFPKLHPWNVKICSTDLNATVIDGFNNLSIASNSLEDSNANDETFEEEKRQFRDNTNTCNDSIDEDPEFGDTTIFYDWKECSTIISDETALNESIVITENLLQLSIPEIRRELQKYGEVPGPITPATKNVYLKRLTRLGSGTTYSKDSQYEEYLPEIRQHIEGRADTPDLCQEEESMCEEFALKKNWREGTEKSSFNYLLIDPRVTQNLPVRAKKMRAEDVFRVFIMSIFYVGKGKRSRPYAHLNEALQSSKHNPKIQQIQDIWAAGLGVVSLHIFQSVIPVEAYTREACMIDALGLSRLTNKKRGDYYGKAQTWPQRKRRQMGVYLLKRALKILLSEGERQLRRQDLKAS